MMDLWYERLEITEKSEQKLLREARNLELLQNALKSGNTVVHPASALFSQLNQRARQIHPDEQMQSEKENRHVK